MSDDTKRLEESEATCQRLAGWNVDLEARLKAAEESRDIFQLQRDTLRDDLNRLNDLLGTPETESFDKAVPLEAAYQVKRWGSEHDAGKAPADWFWLVGYLAGKALVAHVSGDEEKAKHHCISTAAALRNWHSAVRTGTSVMRPGIAPPQAGAVK